MSGKRGKSGSQGGVSNNPSGRPVGSRNKLPNEVKGILEEIFVARREQLELDIEAISNPAIRARLLVDIGKLFVPRPVSDSLEDKNSSESEVIRRLFGREAI